MKDEIPHQSSAETPDPGQEIWLSKEEVMKRYKVTDRQLEYWRDIGRVRYKKIKHRTYYLETEIQAQVKLLARPKKFLFIRKDLLGIKIRRIDPPLAILIVASCFLLSDGLRVKAPWQFWIIYNWPSIELILVALIWYLVRLIKYTWKRLFAKEG